MRAPERGHQLVRMPALQDLYPDEFAHCYGCGRLNADGMHVKSRWLDGEAVSHFLPRPSQMAMPGFVYGGLIASLPLVSVLGMIWLWRDRPDVENMAAHSQATFWYVLPSLPMFLLIPFMVRQGHSFWLSLAAGCVLTIVLYLAMVQVGPRFGLKL